MIWSDNDVANDFTTLKAEDGEQVTRLAFKFEMFFVVGVVVVVAAVKHC
jgi:hypothetical protein